MVFFERKIFLLLYYIAIVQTFAFIIEASVDNFRQTNIIEIQQSNQQTLFKCNLKITQNDLIILQT